MFKIRLKDIIFLGYPTLQENMMISPYKGIKRWQFRQLNFEDLGILEFQQNYDDIFGGLWSTRPPISQSLDQNKMSCFFILFQVRFITIGIFAL